MNIEYITFEEFAKRFPKVKPQQLKEIFTELNLPMQIEPKETWKLQRVQLKLAWDNGHKITTDDYGVAAAYVGKKAGTMQVYLSKGNGQWKFKDPRSSGAITVTKLVLGKPLPRQDYICLQAVYDFNPRINGIYNIREICELVMKMPLQRLRKILNQRHGVWENIEKRYGTINLFAVPEGMTDEEFKRNLGDYPVETLAKYINGDGHRPFNLEF